MFRLVWRLHQRDRLSEEVVRDIMTLRGLAIRMPALTSDGLWHIQVDEGDIRACGRGERAKIRPLRATPSS